MGYFSYQLDEDEDLIALWRSHPVTLAPALAKTIISLVLARVAYQVVQDMPFGPELVLFWILASIFYLVHAVVLWYLNCYIMTTKRIIDIDQKGIFRRQVAEAELGSSLEAVSLIEGPLQALFDYGTVRIRTSAAGSIIALERVPQPERIKQLISKTQAKQKA